MLDGKPTILGGNEIAVTQLIVEKENRSITSETAKNLLSQKRFNFGIAETNSSVFHALWIFQNIVD